MKTFPFKGKHLNCLFVIDDEHYVSFQVMEMDEVFRCDFENGVYYYEASNGINVQSSVFPSISENLRVVFLRGAHKDMDGHVSKLDMPFKTQEQAVLFVKERIKALRDWDTKFFKRRKK
jgi:hypothetical protein